MTSQATDIEVDSPTTPRASTALASSRLPTYSIASNSNDMIITIPANAQDWNFTGQETVVELMIAAKAALQATTKLVGKICFRLTHGDLVEEQQTAAASSREAEAAADSSTPGPQQQAAVRCQQQQAAAADSDEPLLVEEFQAGEPISPARQPFSRKPSRREQLKLFQLLSQETQMSQMRSRSRSRPGSLRRGSAPM